MVAVDRYVVIQTITGGHDSDPSQDLDTESFMYLVDPEAGKVWLTWKE